MRLKQLLQYLLKAALLAAVLAAIVAYTVLDREANEGMREILGEMGYWRTFFASWILFFLFWLCALRSQRSTLSEISSSKRGTYNSGYKGRSAVLPALREGHPDDPLMQVYPDDED